MIDQPLRLKLIQTLRDLPVLQDFGARTRLMDGLPLVSINRSQDNEVLDLSQIVAQLDQIGRIRATGVRPLVVLVDNALIHPAADSSTYLALQGIRVELDRYYAGETEPPEGPPALPEILVFKGRDERVPLGFLERAMVTGRSVARLRVPRIFNNVRADKEPRDVFGTGWIVAPGILITNHHVIDARDLRYEPHASPADFKAQAEGVSAWFGYHHEGAKAQAECEGAELLASDLHLDYALIRLKEPAKVADRVPLPIVPVQPTLQRGHRLNIVQHSGGGPLGYAIRNNFYVGTGASADFLRYLTDTEKGSSGSPLLDDVWQVVGLHHAATPVPPEAYAAVPHEPQQPLAADRAETEVITFHNEGIAIHSILNQLSPELKQEISVAQGWA